MSQLLRLILLQPFFVCLCKFYYFIVISRFINQFFFHIAAGLVYVYHIVWIHAGTEIIIVQIVELILEPTNLKYFISYVS